MVPGGGTVGIQMDFFSSSSSSFSFSMPPTFGCKDDLCVCMCMYMTIRVKQCLQMPNLWKLLNVYAPLRIPHASPRKVNAPLRKVNAPLGKVNAPLRKVNAPLRKVNVLCS